MTPNWLSETREALAEVLRSVEVAPGKQLSAEAYVPERWNPPVAVVVPAQSGDWLDFGGVRGSRKGRWDIAVVVRVPQAGGKPAEQQLEHLAMAVRDVLVDAAFGVERVTPPVDFRVSSAEISGQMLAVLITANKKT